MLREMKPDKRPTVIDTCMMIDTYMMISILILMVVVKDHNHNESFSKKIVNNISKVAL